MKVSEITAEKLADYSRIDEYSDEEVLAYLKSIKSYISSYTGLTEDEMDKHEDLSIAVLIIFQDMWDNRCMHVEKNNLNHTVVTILNMHCVNLL